MNKLLTYAIMLYSLIAA